MQLQNSRAPKASKIFDHFFRNGGSTPSCSAIKSTTANSPPRLPQQCVAGHRFGQTKGRGIRELGQSTTSGPNGNCSNYIRAPQLGVVRKTYLWTTLPKSAPPTIQPTVCGVVHWHMRHSTKSHRQPTPHPVPAHSLGHYWWKQPFRVFSTGIDRPSATLQTAKKTPFRILVGIYYHVIPTHTPQTEYHGVTEVAKTANIPKMAKKCINRTSARPTPPHTNPMESGPGNTSLAQSKKNQKIHVSRPQKRGGHFFDIFDPPPPPATSLKTSKKWVSSGGGLGGGGGPDQKLVGGCIYWTK